MKRFLLPAVAGLSLLMGIGRLNAAETRITVEVDKPNHAISPMLFGVFFEDINLSADGGIYPEMVRNRSFEDADTLQNWTFTGEGNQCTAAISNGEGTRPAGGPGGFRGPRPMQPAPLNAYNRKSAQIKLNGSFRLQNPGYFGMNIVQGEQYFFKAAVRSGDGFNGPLKIRLVGTGGETLASGEVADFKTAWSYVTLSLTAAATDHKAHLEMTGKGQGTLFLDMVSLLPAKTWKNHGMRTDLAEAMNALKPRFMRFPGGCWVEGEDFAHMNHWKNTIGNVDTRTPLWNIWGYNATHGLGYHEYLQLAEDMGCEPLYCINAGVSHREVVPLDQMGQWIQDALDALEYANGPVTSVWGSIRARNGHPAPFNLKYLEIGNENGNAPYHERWKLMADAVKANYPDVVLIANFWAGSYPKDPNPAVIDEHYYNNPDWFVRNARLYDKYDRKGPKIFVGEYAVTSQAGNGNLRGAIGEAAFMTGLERNSDIVEMAAYAPLFCNANHKRWPINLINFDSYRWFGLPSYYVQKLFAENQGTQNIPVTITGAPAIKAPASKGGMGIGTWNNSAEFKELKVVDAKGKVLYQNDFSANMDGLKTGWGGDWKIENGVLRQSAIATNITAYIGDSTWNEYTITVKARKIAGENGFQIYFHSQARGGQRFRWDLGGYNDAVYMIDSPIATSSMEGKIEPGRWYDVKLEVRQNSIKGYLDGKLIQEASEKTADGCLFVSASTDERSGDLIVKVVNSNPTAVKATVELKSRAKLAGKGKLVVLTSANPLDENTLDNPRKVVPKESVVSINGNLVKSAFPGNSLTIIRVPQAGK